MSSPSSAPCPTARLVVCLGDSITRGQVSSDYVARLQSRPRATGTRFVNAGVNGDLAYNVAARLDGIVEQDPDIVTLLVGTNDVNAQYDDAWTARYRKDQRLPVPPTREWYAEQLAVVLDRLRDGTRARLAVLEIPPLGEDLSSRMNGLVEEYNNTLRAVASPRGLPVLPLHERLVALVPTDRPAPPYVGSTRTVMLAAARHLLLRQSWAAISRRNGLSVLTDHIHLNDRAADVVADLIEEFLDGLHGSAS